VVNKNYGCKDSFQTVCMTNTRSKNIMGKDLNQWWGNRLIVFFGRDSNGHSNEM
jgi:hypothetical protein